MEDSNGIAQGGTADGKRVGKRGHWGVEGLKAMQTKSEEDMEGWSRSRRHSAPSPARAQAPPTLAVCPTFGAVVGSDAFTVPWSNGVRCAQPAQWFPVPWGMIWSLRKQCFSDEEPGNFEGKNKASPKPWGWAGQGEKGGDERIFLGAGRQAPCGPHGLWDSGDTTRAILRYRRV